MYDNFVNAPVNYVTSLGLVNGHLTWSDSRQSWQAIVGVTNLLNKWYFTSTTSADAPPPAPQLWGSYIARVGEPREFTISARRNF
jgi:iron complex outermembrane receptor protein